MSHHFRRYFENAELPNEDRLWLRLGVADGVLVMGTKCWKKVMLRGYMHIWSSFVASQTENEFNLNNNTAKQYFLAESFITDSAQLRDADFKLQSVFKHDLVFVQSKSLKFCACGRQLICTTSASFLFACNV